NGELIWVREPDAGKRLRAVAEGTAHIAASVDPAAHAPSVVTVHRYRAPVAIIYLLNAAHGALRDPRVRKALTLAVDREAVVRDVLDDNGDPLHGFVGPAHFGAGVGNSICHDPEAARQLLAEAGHAAGLELEVDCPTRLPDEAQRLTEVLACQLASIGVTLKVHIYEEREDYAHMVRRKEIRDLCVFDSSPMSTFRVLYEKIDSRVAGAWWQGYRNERVEALIDRGRKTVDETEREALYREAYHLLQQDPPWLTLYNPTRAIALAGDHPGFSIPVDGVPDMRGLPKFEGARNG
ncbi:ABC transporter substrate-binding protein, partial [Roseibium sp.]|uniref:ABC transporter substrate-binding protein n=1 Tax=Roseibium sp. TaxID=1936156 RepID=UPI003D0BC9E8